MVDSIAKPLAAHRKRIEALLDDAHRWAPQDLVRCPSLGQWCALDVLDHLARTERSIAERMREGLARPHPIPPADRLRTAAVFAVIAAPSRVRTPAGVEMVIPETPPSLDIAERLLREAHAHLTNAAGAVTANLRRWGVFRHPVGGWMSPSTTVRFVAVHLRHHEYQWKRLKTALS